ncbi:MAG: HNH endonuclease [Thermodesulfobacteriota bacterium]
MAQRPERRRVTATQPWEQAVDGDAIKREKNRARELRQTQWWKQRLSRGLCYYCGKPFRPDDLTMDHVVPLARGGKTTKSNVVTACKSCNTKKKQMVPVEWEEYLRILQGQ